jgi:ketosteroid isomerase-like protein
MESGTFRRDTAWAMSEENIEMARSWLDRWNRGERTLPSDEIHADVEVVSRFRTEPYRGSDGIRRWTAEIDEQFEEWHIVVDHWRALGDDVVALGQIQLRGRSSAVQFDQPAGVIIEIRDGKLSRLRLFNGHKETLEAAGLSE